MKQQSSDDNKETVRSGERKHDILPGRTSDSPRREVKYTIDKSKEENPEKERVAVAATPKLDLNFSIKLGQFKEGLLKRSEQQNTGAQVDGTFHPDNRAGGGYGTTFLPEEDELMVTPALPNGDDDGSGAISNIRIASVGERFLRKLAAAQLPLPTPDDDTPGRVQPAGRPQLSETLGVLGGTAGGAGLGSAIARGANLSGSAALAPVVGGAVGGGLLGGMTGPKVERALQTRREESTPEELGLQQLLQVMRQQNPEFYREQAARAVPQSEEDITSLVNPDEQYDEQLTQ